MWRTRVVIFAMVAATQFVTPAPGQVGGRVVDGQSRPLPSVAVELWAEGRRVATRRTGAGGEFRFEATEPSAPVQVRAQMLGYSPAERSVSPPSRDLVLRLTPTALQIEGITASATPPVRCPARESEEARALWNDLRAGYDSSADSMGVSFYSRRLDTVTRSPFEVVPDEELFVRSWYGIKGRVGQEDAIHVHPYEYGFPILTSFDPAYVAWRYRALATTDGGHFIEDSFGAAHSLSILARRGRTTVVAFCPLRPSPKGPSLQGALTIEQRAGLVRAEWTFHTPNPAQDAGGEVSFVSRGTERSPLLPARTLFWRKIVGQQLYFVRFEHFAAYELLPPDVHPVSSPDWLFPSDTP